MVLCHRELDFVCETCGLKITPMENKVLLGFIQSSLTCMSNHSVQRAVISNHAKTNCT